MDRRTLFTAHTFYPTKKRLYSRFHTAILTLSGQFDGLLLTWEEKTECDENFTYRKMVKWKARTHGYCGVSQWDCCGSTGDKMFLQLSPSTRTHRKPMQWSPWARLWNLRKNSWSWLSNVIHVYICLCAVNRLVTCNFWNNDFCLTHLKSEIMLPVFCMWMSELSSHIELWLKLSLTAHR